MADNDGKGVTQSYFETELKKYDNKITVTKDEKNNTFKVKFPSGNKYTVQTNGVIEKDNENNGITVDQIFDINGKNETDEGYDETKLHIGDFINYDAGSWTQKEIDNIKVGLNSSLVTASGSEELPPNEAFQFGGFKAGKSRNENATTFDSTNNYVEANGDVVTGWRLFDVNDGSIVLISAGCPEYYYHKSGANDGYISEYILSGHINDDAKSMNLDETYTKRSWDNYVNRNEKAISAEVLTKSRLENWYNKYMGRSEDLYDSDEAFQSVYGTKYETIVDNYSCYWLGSTKSARALDLVNPSNRNVGNMLLRSFGVRLLVTLSSEVKLSKTSAETKTIIDPRDYSNSWRYNVWNIE